MRFCLFTALVLALTAFPAYGYLDPASGSMILQLIIGGIAGAAVVVKLYWQKLKSALGLKGDDGDDGDRGDGDAGGDDSAA